MKKLYKINPETKTRIPSPFDIEDYKTERSAVAVLMHWMRNIIEQSGLDLGLPDVEPRAQDQKMPDLVIYKTCRSRDVVCVIECKQPYFDLFNEKELKEPAWNKARKRKAKYFATSNFRELILWDTEKVNAQKPEEEQIVAKYHLSEINDINLIEDSRYKKSIINELEKFLKDFYEILTGKKAAPKIPIDELLVWRLHEKIRKLADYYREIISNQTHKNPKFAKDLIKWFTAQGWSFAWQDEGFDKAARQTAYLLVNKIIFYNALQIKRPDKLDKLKIPEDITRGGLLQGVLQAYFNQVLKIDYETIYTADFIDQIAFPDGKEVVEEIKDLVNILERYDFATLGFDIIGRIFERLIPQEERHNLGQYFTNPDIVDLILKFCLKHENDKILDPSCGAGTFLVRAYQHKKLMNQYLKHEDILDTLWGVDIAKFPAHLATINLAINDLSVDKNYPNVIQEDFFNLLTKPDGSWLPESWRKARAKTLGQEEREIQYPRYFTCIVGNPPYTRQEEIGEISPENLGYKESLIKKALFEEGKQLAEISKRAGIYAYFFVHGTKFLQNGGKFGFIVSNAWLDVDYGKGLQEFFLKNYKIVSIIESKVERWFEEADINTCIVILEKCSGKERSKERNENLVRFVYLKKPLRYFIPAAQDIWEKQIQRLQAIDNLIKTIIGHDEFYENEDLRIFPKKQKELYEEGFDAEENKYTGSKWGKYLRAPEIFFKILEKGKGKLIQLKDIATVRRGYIPYPYEDYLFNEKKVQKFKVEKKYLVPVFRSTEESKQILLDDPTLFHDKLLMVNKAKKDLEGTKVLEYIQWIEKHSKKGQNWYILGAREPSNIIWLRTPYVRHIAYLNKIGLMVIDHVEIKSKFRKSICLLLNSTLYALFREIFGRTTLGQGTLKTEVIDVKKFPVVSPEKLQEIEKKIKINRFLVREIGSIFEEIGASSVDKISFNKVKPDRRELDKIIMGEILGLTDEEQLEVYKAVIDLVKSRIEKAKSFGKRKITKNGLDVDALINTILGKIGENTLKKFYKEKILSQKRLYTKKLPQLSEMPQIEKTLFGWRLVSGKCGIECHSESEARYLKVWLEARVKSIKVPKDEKYLESVTDELEELKTNLDKIISSYLSSILNIKVKNQILHQLWQKIV